MDFTVPRDARRLTVLLALAVLLPAGCGGGDRKSDETAAQDPVSTAQRPTPEALLGALRAALNASPPKYDAFHDLWYAENEAQRKFLEVERLAHDYVQILDAAMMDRFGERWSSIEDPFPIWPVDEMRIVTSERDRAEALCSDRPRGESRQGRRDLRLYMVRIGDEWFASGFTWEYRPDFPAADSIIYEERMMGYQRQHRDLAIEYADLIRSGAFDTPRDARRGFIPFAEERLSE
jgi:hypothetical protein